MSGSVDVSSWTGHISHRRLTVFLASPTQRVNAWLLVFWELSKKTGGSACTCIQSLDFSVFRIVLCLAVWNILQILCFTPSKVNLEVLCGPGKKLWDRIMPCVLELCFFKRCFKAVLLRSVPPSPLLRVIPDNTRSWALVRGVLLYTSHCFSAFTSVLFSFLGFTKTFTSDLSAFQRLNFIALTFCHSLC